MNTALTSLIVELNRVMPHYVVLKPKGHAIEVSFVIEDEHPTLLRELPPKEIHIGAHCTASAVMDLIMRHIADRSFDAGQRSRNILPSQPV